MVYPKSPFLYNKDIKESILNSRQNIFEDNDEQINIVFEWLCQCPTITTYKINTLVTNYETVSEKLTDILKKISAQHDLKITPKVSRHPILDDVIIINHISSCEKLDLQPRNSEIIVDPQCGAAILRGANIFAPGVLGMLTGTKLDDIVSVYADLSGKCLKGYSKHYKDPDRQFLGNGIVRKQRHQLFNESKTSGIAVEMISTISHCPNIRDDYLPKGHVLLQNIPSVVCGYNLNPLPNDVVLDMCAAPGNKTVHIAELIKNNGTVIALEKVKSKIPKLIDHCRLYSAHCVKIFQCDSTQIVSTITNDNNVLNGPPFNIDSFDKILLDAPCSGLGQRPQLINRIKRNVLESYPPLQKKLFKVAVQLLKPKGRLVYSTCTIVPNENETMVSWALKSFPSLELVQADLRLGDCGWKGYGLSDRQCELVQRYGPPVNGYDEFCDSVGFFIACFVKK